MNSPTRPILRYHGGKWLLAPWIIDHLPAHRVYVEPFGGAASVLLRKPRAYAEVYNDLDCEVVNLFRVVRERGDELKRALELTPFARDEFLSAWNADGNALEQARRTIVRAFMGFGSASVTMGRCPENPKRGGLAKTGFRSNSNRSGTTPAHDWANYPSAMDAIIERLRGVVIENRDAVDVMRQHDSAETLHYVDPPYHPSARDAGDDYKYELTGDDHLSLIHVLKNLTGMVVLSGYRCDLYDSELSTWSRIDRKAFADGANARTESIWLNKHAERNQEQFTLAI